MRRRLNKWRDGLNYKKRLEYAFFGVFTIGYVAGFASGAYLCWYA